MINGWWVLCPKCRHTWKWRITADRYRPVKTKCPKCRAIIEEFVEIKEEDVKSHEVNIQEVRVVATDSKKLTLVIQLQKTSGFLKPFRVVVPVEVVGSDLQAHELAELIGEEGIFHGGPAPTNAPPNTCMVCTEPGTRIIDDVPLCNKHWIKHHRMRWKEWRCGKCSHKQEQELEHRTLDDALMCQHCGAVMGYFINDEVLIMNEKVHSVSDTDSWFKTARFRVGERVRLDPKRIGAKLIEDKGPGVVAEIMPSYSPTKIGVKFDSEKYIETPETNLMPEAGWPMVEKNCACGEPAGKVPEDEAAQCMACWGDSDRVKRSRELCYAPMTNDEFLDLVNDVADRNKLTVGDEFCCRLYAKVIGDPSSLISMSVTERNKFVRFVMTSLAWVASDEGKLRVVEMAWWMSTYKERLNAR